MFKHVKWNKVVPLLIVVVLAYLIAGTDVLSETWQTQIIAVLKDYVKGIVPFTASIFVGLIFVLLANVLYDPMKAVLERALNLSHADERGKKVVARIVLPLYWLIVVFVGVSLVAPDFLSKLVVGFGIFGAAITLALQGVAQDGVAGIMLYVRPKFCIGDEIELIGVAVKGKVIDTSYALTVIETADGMITVPNREVWSKPVKVTKPGSGTRTEGGAVSCPTVVTPPVAPASTTTEAPK